MSISELYDKFKKSSGASTDTRKIEPGSMFFALKGDKFNANEFAAHALEAGAAYAVIDEAEFARDERFILVDDVLKALQDLANVHRKTFTFPVIGLTGSNGKTTNKELLSGVLSKKYIVYATKGNLNNHIGVPLTLLAIKEDCEIAVVEMGANHQQEIEMLCGICEPTHGFITNVGKAHLEGFGGVEGVKKGKGELFDFLSHHHGTVFINDKNPTLLDMASTRSFDKIVYYGSDDHTLKLEHESPRISFTRHDKTYFTHLSGYYNFENMQTAFAVGLHFDVPEEDACEAIAAYNPDNNRSQVIEQGSNSLYMDAYNANPSSMAASLNNFINLETPKQKVVILGDMFELGEYSDHEHAELGRLVADGHFDLVVLYGENMKHALVHLPQAYYFTDKFSLHNWLDDRKIENACILVKGSRGVGLESVVRFL